MNFLLLALLRAGQLGMIAADEADMSSLCGIERDDRFVAVSLIPTFARRDGRPTTFVRGDGIPLAVGVRQSTCRQLLLSMTSLLVLMDYYAARRYFILIAIDRSRIRRIPIAHRRDAEKSDYILIYEPYTVQDSPFGLDTLVRSGGRPLASLGLAPCRGGCSAKASARCRYRSPQRASSTAVS